MTSSLKGYAAVVAGAVAWVALLAAIGNVVPPFSDALSYVSIAEHGLGNGDVAAPFAYRPGTPYLVRGLMAVLPITVDEGFQILVFVSAVALLVAAYALARSVATPVGAALPVAVVGLSAMHVKFPLFVYALIDVEAFALVTLAFVAWTRGHRWLCFALGCVGLLFKEFLILPVAVVLVEQAAAALKRRSTRHALACAGAILLVVAIVLVPRLLVSVPSSVQEIDPLNRPATLQRLLAHPFDDRRLLIVAFSVLAYWLPTFLLVTRERALQVVDELRPHRQWMLLYLGITLLLTIYGGTNVLIFVSYSIVPQVLVLAALTKTGLSTREVAWALFVTLMFNKIPLNIPDPRLGMAAYLDHFAGHANITASSSLVRGIVAGCILAATHFARALMRRECAAR